MAGCPWEWDGRLRMHVLGSVQLRDRLGMQRRILSEYSATSGEYSETKYRVAGQGMGGQAAHA